MKHSDLSNIREILRLAWPAIVSNLTVPLLGLSDTFISGHLGSESYLAAIAAATTMVNSIYWLFGFLRMGTTGLTAQAYGARDAHRQADIFTRAILTAVIGGLLLTLLSPLTLRLLSFIMHPPEEVARHAAEYFYINMLGAPAFLATMATTGRLLGRSNTFYAMIVSVTVNLGNILLSIGLVFLAATGFKGVAIGTTAANWLGFLLSLYLVRRDSRGMALWTGIRALFSREEMRRFFSVNIYLFFRSAFLMGVTFAMTGFAARIGTLALAANAILTQFFLFFSYFMDGFAFSGEALCGKHLGAGDHTGLRHTIRDLFICGAAMTAIFTPLYGAIVPVAATWLSDSMAVASLVTQLRWTCICVPAVSVAAFILDGVYIGLTRTRAMMGSTLAGFAVFMLMQLIPSQGLYPREAVLWTAFIAYLAVRGIVLGLLLRGVLSDTHCAARNTTPGATHNNESAPLTDIR